MHKVLIRNLKTPEYSVNEAFNTLATNISYCGDDIRAIELTSRYQHEGKSYVSMQLFRTFAGFGKTVVLIDADLRRSNMNGKYQISFDTEKPQGLTQYLAGLCGISDIVYETNIEGAFYVPAGRLVSNSLQLLKNDRLGLLIDQLCDSADIVLIDTPPAGLIVDAVEVAKHCDGALLVVDYGEGHKREVGDIADAINRTGCQVLGAVMNAVDMSAYTNRKYYYSGKYYRRYYHGNYESNY